MVTEYRKVFLDTAPFIYLLDHDMQYMDCVKRFFDELLAQGIPLVTSTVTVAEYLVQPYKRKATESVKRFFTFFDDADIQVIPIGTEIAESAAKIRAEYPAFKAMDALQLATARIEACDAFLTNDKQLRQFQHLRYIMVDELEKKGW